MTEEPRDDVDRPELPNETIDLTERGARLSAPSEERAIGSRELPELDEESSDEVQRTFVILFFVGGGICLVPRQWVSAAILFGLAIVAMVARRMRSQRRSQVSSSGSSSGGRP